MGTFNFLIPILDIDSTFGGASSSLSLVTFRTSYLMDPWTLPSLVESREVCSAIRVDMLLSIVYIYYQVVLDIIAEFDLSSSWMEEEDILVPPAWGADKSWLHDFLDET